MLRSLFLSQNYLAIYKPQLFFLFATSHRADWILTNCCLFCLAFLYAHVFNLIKVLEVERLGFRLLENYFKITLFFVQCLLRSHTLLFLFHSCLLFLVYISDVFGSVFLCSMYCVLIAYCCIHFRWVFFIYPLHLHDLCSCSFCLLFLGETVLGRFHLHNNIYKIGPPLIGQISIKFKKGVVFWPIGLDSYWIKDFKAVFVMVGSWTGSEI